MKLHLRAVIILLSWIQAIQLINGLLTIQSSDPARVHVRNRARFSRASSVNMVYHGGPILTNPVVYVIWYGTWQNTVDYTIVNNFLSGFGSTKWWQINYAYGVQSGVQYGGSIFDFYSQGPFVTDTGIFNIFQRSLSNGLPTTPSAIYMVLTSPDVVEVNDVFVACGWHNYATDNKGNYYTYGWAGNPGIINFGCIYQMASPNLNTGADAIVSIIAHELAEAATDPELNAWYATNGYENGDLCAWNFGTTQTLLNGAKWNIQIGSNYYLIQQLWNLNKTNCTMTP